jgi:hypothetical protein
VANSGESQQQWLQRLCQSWQQDQAWSGRRESNTRSQLGKLSESILKQTHNPSSKVRYVVIFDGESPGRAYCGHTADLRSDQ